VREIVVSWVVAIYAGVCLAQTPVHPVIVSNPETGGRVSVVEVRPHFVTAIRLPETVNSVAVGDPRLFEVEHSPAEPSLVFVKAITTEPAESNLLISTASGRETSLLLVSKGDTAKQVDVLVQYKHTRSFLVEPDYPSALVGETVPTADAMPAAASVPTNVAGEHAIMRPVSLRAASDPPAGAPATSLQPSSLDVLLRRQEHAPLPELYGEHPVSQNPSGDRVKAGVSEVIDGGQQVIVLFSTVNPTKHAILLVPPQVQLGGKIRKGKIFRHWRWTTAEQLSVEDFRLSTRRLAPGERADGVVVFERPPYKQSNETLFLQVAEAGAIDKPALAPIGFGVNKLRNDEASNGPGEGKQP
jgi:hypothetical protein